MSTGFRPQHLKVSELQLGDNLQLFEGPYGTATVTKIAKGYVTMTRPYGTTADFSYSAEGGSQVIPYTGIEECTYALDSKQTFLVYSRKDLK